MRKDCIRKGEYYQMEYDAWDEGTVELTLEAEAAFLRLCHQMYRRKGPIPNSEKLLVALWRCHKNKARNLLRLLIDRGKIQVTPEGHLMNTRVRQELDRRETLGRHRADAGHIGGTHSGDSRRKSLEDNDSDEAIASHMRSNGQYIRGEEKREEEKRVESHAGADAPKIFSEWDFVSDDGSVHFTADEIAEIEQALPALKNIRGAIRMAYRGWAKELPAEERKNAIRAHLTKKERDAIARNDRAEKREQEQKEQERRDRQAAKRPRAVRPAW